MKGNRTKWVSSVSGIADDLNQQLGPGVLRGRTEYILISANSQEEEREMEGDARRRFFIRRAADGL